MRNYSGKKNFLTWFLSCFQALIDLLFSQDFPSYVDLITRLPGSTDVLTDLQMQAFSRLSAEAGPLAGLELHAIIDFYPQQPTASVPSSPPCSSAELCTARLTSQSPASSSKSSASRESATSDPKRPRLSAENSLSLSLQAPGV